MLGLANLCAGLSDRNLDVVVFGVRLDREGPGIDLGNGVESCVVRGYHGLGFRVAPGLERRIIDRVCDSDLVHSHGLWSSASRTAYVVSRRLGLAHLISTHGMLAADALRFRQWKKLPVAWWFQDRALAAAECLHVTSGKELHEVREYGLRNPVAVIPMPVRCEETTPETEREVSDRIGDARVVLFLGRLHPVKGLDRLVDAWAGLRTNAPGWRLVIAGPDEGAYGRELRAKVDAAGLSADVLFFGEADEFQKAALMRRADLFVLPSDFENFGMVVAEALSSGVPVIASTGTPWSNLPRAGAGWWIASSVSAISGALREAMATPGPQLKEMGRNAVRMAEEYSIARVSEKFDRLYRWMRHDGERPEFVDLS